MKKQLLRFIGATYCLLMFGLSGVAQVKPAMQWTNIADWEYIRTFNSVISPDGSWLTWVSGPTKGDLTLTLKHTGDTLVYAYPIGATSTSAVFSDDGKYVAFRESPKDKEVEAAKKSKKTLYSKLHVISMLDTSKVTFDRIRNFSFSGENPDWIAISLMAAEGAPKGDQAPKGTDLLLHQLSTKTTQNLGNIAEFAFNKPGTLLAYIIDAQGQHGNGVWVRDLKTGVTTPIDVDKANYKQIRWNDEGTAFTLLKASKHDDYKSDVYTVIGVSQYKGNQFDKVLYNGLDDEHFPEGKGISGNGMVYWSDDLKTLFFGIAELERKGDKNSQDSTAKEDSKAKAKTDDIPRPDMIIWNWQDKRLQSAQQVQQMRDRNFSFASAYDVRKNQFIPLADPLRRTVVVGPKQLYALAYDYTPYEVENNLSGQSYVDIHLLDLQTGEHACILENHYQNASRTVSFAPNGQHIVYYRDGVYYSMDLRNQQETALTAGIDASFINEQTDTNVEKPATPVVGWSADSKYILIRDNFDLWKISVDGKKAISLSPNWKKDGIRVNGHARIYPDDEGIDLRKTQYFSIFNDKTKQAGYAILESGKDQFRILMLDDHSYGPLQKAAKSDAFLFTRESSVKSPELFIAHGPDLSGARQLTQNTPHQDKYAWSEGVRLIEFVSAQGDTLQAALYLPANYEPGKSYPTVTYIYERLTQGLNGYANPSYPGGGFNRAIYTSNGYAVLMPDIKYQLNEPGNSAVDCVVPAVEAAIATGIVDKDRVGIHGHSWGGYQTSFLITQTNIFKAAAAGAPLTNMISMYSLIYWNSGSTNQSIFESSQGRLTTGYWDNWDAYKRNSPIYYIKNVETPLLLLHNDKDGAVDYTQGIEYYNGLRRLNKPVTMITYKGENHGIVKEENRKDYAVRMLEFMDHYLKDAPAPDWWAKGVDLLDMKKHLDERAF